MKNTFGLFLLLLQLGIQAQNPNPSATVDSYILSEMNAENVPGMSTLIVKGGEIVWTRSYGPADIGNGIQVTDSTIFLLASVSKLVTGTALMHLFQEGQLDLDEDINNHLPFSVDIPNFEADSITFRMLMTHTSSITDNETVMDTYYSTGDPTISLPDVIQRYFSTAGSDYSAADNFSNNAPGTNYGYSNMATALSGYMVEVVSGMPFSEYCNTYIFNKLCMNNTSWYLSGLDINNIARPYQWSGGQYVPYGHYGFADYPNGQLRSTVLDLANFMLAFLQNGSFNGQPFLNSNSVDQMLMPQIPNLDATQGLNWYTEEIYLTTGGTVDLWGHNGGERGASTDLYIDRANQIGVVVLSNGEGDNLNVVDELYNYALTLSPSGVGNPACVPLSIAENTEPKEVVSIYPNPSDGSITVGSKIGSLREVLVYNSLGQMVEKIISKENRIELEIETEGMYFIQVLTTDGNVMVSKIVVNR